MQKIRDNWLLILITLGLGIGLALVLDLKDKKISAVYPVARVLHTAVDPQYRFINPLLGFDTAEATDYGQLVDLKDQLNHLVNQEVGQKNANKISLYFRDSYSSRWIGINPDETFSPASLLKVPLMIAYYRWAENTPAVLSRAIKFDGKNDIDNEETIQPSQKLEAGKTYTVDQLINEMIIYSDNDAMQVLLSNVDTQVLNKVFIDMDILLPTNGQQQDFITAKNYSLFLRVLRAATYLSKYDSEKALELLAQSAFKDGLVAGVPSDVAVAHKFGEYGLIDPVTHQVSNREFHDCGEIFYPKDTYLLCVMTKGNDLGKLEQSVRDVSKAVFEYVQKNNQ